MDSKERDTREKKGFSERGDKIYNPKNKKNKTKESFKYDPSDRNKRGNPKDINDQADKNKNKKSD
jgi:hypothetical protein